MQGPFPTKQMRYWFETGSFFDTLYVSFKRDEWKMLKEYYPRIELAFLVLVLFPLLSHAARHFLPPPTPPGLPPFRAENPVEARQRQRQAEELRLRLEEEAQRVEAQRVAELQRQAALQAVAKESLKPEKEPVAPVAPVAPAAPVAPVASEEATNASEAKIFAVLDAMGIGHVATGEA